MPADEIRFVQFLHPGKEHRPNTIDGKNWNENGHRRTFVEQPGQFLRGLGDQAPTAANLHFWCEWECEARLVKSFDGKRKAGYPRYLFQPQIERHKDFSQFTNTDPFVFGNAFRYSACKMHGKMKRLKKGSVVLFGAHWQGRFILDTVFVVGNDAPRFDVTNWQSFDLESQFRDATLAPMFSVDPQCPPSKTKGHGSNKKKKKKNKKAAIDDWWRLYEGATPKNAVDGMFSFFPCLPAEESEESHGFARPRVRIPRVITPELKMGLNIESPIEPAKAKDLWTNVIEQVTKAKLCLGVWAKTPEYNPE